MMASEHFTCASCKFVYKGFGTPNICPECGKKKWVGSEGKKDTKAPEKKERNPLDDALEMLERYDEDCEPRSMDDMDE